MIDRDDLPAGYPRGGRNAMQLIIKRVGKLKRGVFTVYFDGKKCCKRRAGRILLFGMRRILSKAIAKERRESDMGTPKKVINTVLQEIYKFLRQR